MKKVLLMTAAIALFAVPAMAASIVSTKHNLSTSGTGTVKSAAAQSQICIFCHTPHNATLDVPLWNRTNPSGATTGYTGSASINSTIPANLAADSISRFCLSCHDGGTVGARVVNAPVADVTNGDVVRAYANLGTDLTNDHPVGFTVTGVNVLDAKIKVETTWGLPLFNSANGVDQLECATCHDVHGANGFAKFVRVDNAGSALCLTCHDK